MENQLKINQVIDITQFNGECYPAYSVFLSEELYTQDSVSGKLFNVK